MKKRLILVSVIALSLVITLSSCDLSVLEGIDLGALEEMLGGNVDVGVFDPFGENGGAVDKAPSETISDISSGNVIMRPGNIMSFVQISYDELVAKSRENTVTFTDDARYATDLEHISEKNAPITDSGEYLFSRYQNRDFAMQREAYEHFNEMVADFYDATGNNNLCVFEAYAYNGAHRSIFDSALSVDLRYISDDKMKRPLYETSDYDWMFDNSYKYGFVFVSLRDGRDCVFRYVGVAHALALKDTEYGAHIDLLNYASAAIYKMSADNVSYYMLTTDEGKTEKYGVYGIRKDAEKISVPASADYSVIECADGFLISFKSPLTFVMIGGANGGDYNYSYSDKIYYDGNGQIISGGDYSGAVKVETVIRPTEETK